MCTEDEITERQQALALASVVFSTAQQFEMIRTAELDEDQDGFGSLVPEPTPERPPAGRDRISLPEPGDR